MTSARRRMGTAMRYTQLSVRVYHRILKLACTISDLGGEERSVFEKL